MLTLSSFVIMWYQGGFFLWIGGGVVGGNFLTQQGGAGTTLYLGT